MTFRLSSVRILAAVFGIAIAAPAAFTQIPSWGVDTFQAPADPRWSAIATQDVEAAFRLIRDNHPGAAPELHDLEFQQRLKNAHTLALKRARTADVEGAEGSKIVGQRIKREYLLPMFSTLQPVDPNAPSQVGPFVPALTYNGDIADTAALEAWVIATAVPAAAR